jgi:hypothetical protein
MNVIYLFYESEKVRIPFYDYDPELFKLLRNPRNGKLDNERKEFIFILTACFAEFCKKRLRKFVNL